MSFTNQCQYQSGTTTLLLCGLLSLHSCQSHLNIVEREAHTDISHTTDTQQDAISGALEVASTPTTSYTSDAYASSYTEQPPSAALHPPHGANASTQQDALPLPTSSAQQEQGDGGSPATHQQTTEENALEPSAFLETNTSTDPGPLYEVFIGHAGEDKQTVAIPLYEELKRLGIYSYIDKKKFRTGRYAPEAMIRAIETARCGVFILSPEFVAKKQPMEELRCFLRRHKEAKNKGQKPPLLVPVWHHLAWTDCKMPPHAFFEKHKAHFSAEKNGFLKRVEAKDTTIEQVIEYLQALHQLEPFAGAKREKKHDYPLVVETAQDIHKEIGKIWPTRVKLSRPHIPRLYNYTAHTKKSLYYVTRSQEIDRLREVLEQQGVCVLHGDGGSGKSTLAYHYACSAAAQSATRQIVWFVPAAPDKIQVAFQDLLQKLGTDYRALIEIWKRNLRKYRQELSRIIYNTLEESGQHLFLILDNAKVENEDLIRDFILHRSISNANIIITTRDPIAFTDYENIVLSDFLLEEGIAYVKERLKAMRCHFAKSDKRAFSAAARHLVKAVGFTPLRLDIAMGFLQQNKLHTITRYTEELQLFKDLPDNPLKVYNVSEVDIGLATLDKLAQQVMRYSTNLDVDFIPFSLLETLLEEFVDNLREILRPLEHLSLVTVITENMGIRIHQSVQDSCQAYGQWNAGADMSEVALLNRLVEALCEVMPWVDTSPSTYWETSRLYAPHVSQVLAKATDVLGPHPDVASLLELMGNYQEKVVCDYQQALTYFEQACTMWKILYGEVLHPNIARILSNMGLVYKKLDDANKSIEYKIQAFEMWKALYPDQNHSDVADALLDMGVAYEAFEKPHKELDYKKQALEMREALYSGQDHPEVAEALNNVGLAYEVLGEVQEGLEYKKRSLKMRKALYLDQNHPDIADSLNSIGATYHRLGEPQKGLSYFEEALKIREVLYSSQNHPDLGQSFYNVGITYQRFGDMQKSLEHLEIALDLRGALYLGQNHSDVADALNSLGVAYQKLGEPQKGLAYFEEALQMREALYADYYHIDIAMSLDNVGFAYDVLGESRKGLKYKEQALEARKALYPDQNNSDLARSLNSVGMTYRGLGQLNKGLVYAEQALKMFRDLYPDQDHPGTAMSLNNLGRAYQELGQVKKGIQYQEEALIMYQGLYPDHNHPDIALSLYNVGLGYVALGKAQKAKQCFEAGLAISHKLDDTISAPYVKKFVKKMEDLQQSKVQLLFWRK